MSENLATATSRVVALWRYPFKSMMGEELNASSVTERGLLGDRAQALIDVETGKVVSAKNPRKWPAMFSFRASYTAPPNDARALPAVRITLPDGSMVTSDQANAERRLSEELGRAVRIAGGPIEQPSLEGYWPDHDFLPQRDEVFDVDLPPGTFFDMAAVHLITIATLDRLRELVPQSRFETRRFRPNLVIEVPGASGFVENEWVGRTVAIGEVTLRVVHPCPRCVMTTLAQGDLPKDPGVLRAAVQQNGGNVGVYAAVVQGGRIRRGDTVSVD